MHKRNIQLPRKIIVFFVVTKQKWYWKMSYEGQDENRTCGVHISHIQPKSQAAVPAC